MCSEEPVPLNQHNSSTDLDFELAVLLNLVNYKVQLYAVRVSFFLPDRQSVGACVSTGPQ